MILPAMGSSRGRPRATAVSSPPTMKASVPATAPLTPPDTGASSWAKPCSAACALTVRASSTEIVELSMPSAPEAAAGKTSASHRLPPSPVRRMVITTSPSATASAPLPKTCTPLSAAADEAEGTGSKPRTVCPAATRFAAIGPPMLPRPRNAIVVICGSSLSLLHPGGLGAADHHPHDLVGSLENSVHAQVADDLLQSVLSQIAVSAVQLQRL